MKKCILIAALAISAGLANKAQAAFVIDTSPDGDKFYYDQANKDVSSFTGSVGTQSSGPLVNVTAVGSVDTGAGFSTIKSIKNGSLTTLVFTPVNGNLFDDFNFRGQLNPSADGTVTLTVQDNQGHAPETFTFAGLGSNSDFGRIGIKAIEGSGSTIKSITLVGDFKEEKQNQFSYAAVPEPGTWLAGLSSLGALGLFAWRRRK